jgi:hypothetical protein
MPQFPQLVRVLCFAFLTAATLGQTIAPRVFLKFDNDLIDSSAAGLITAVSPSAGWTPTFTADRNGVANSALVLTGSQSLQLVAGSLPGNSNEALGLRNAGGTNTSFTAAGWVLFTSSGSGEGYSTIFGNPGSGTGTLHAGLGSGVATTHFGFDDNDVNGATYPTSTNVWYHIAFVYDAVGIGSGPTQRIYINGLPEVTRANVTNTLKVADLFLGNWGTATDPANDLKGVLDDIVVYDAPLKGDQIQALFNGVNPNALPAGGTYSAPKLPGNPGLAAAWGVREIKGYPGIPYGTLVDADRIVRAYAAAPGGTVAEYTIPVVNFLDEEAEGTDGYFTNEGDFGTNTPADDDNFLMVAKCAVRIAVEDDYTFGFRGDEGARLRVVGKQFISSTRLNPANPADPAHSGDSLYYVAGTTDSNTLGVVHLQPGNYNLELVWWEGSGGSSVEVYAARGAKTAVDATFQLVGNTAAGGLEIVRDPDTYPQIFSFTANGGNSVFVQGGSPANFTLAWQTNSDVLPGQNVSISPGIGGVAGAGSMLVPSPASTTTYTLTSTAGADIATKSVTIYVDSAPVITSFTASKTTVNPGEAFSLNWAVEGATSLTLQPGNIDVTAGTSRVLTQTATTTYTLVATNGSGSSQAQVTVNLAPPPTINSFTVADPNPLFGAETTLNWDVSNANTISIDQGVGPISGATGSVSILPVQTTTYTLTATNLSGSSTRTATVNQPSPIGVAAPGFSARRVSSTVAFPFAGQGYLQSAISLLGGQNVGATTTNTYATVNFVDGVDGDFTSGNTAFPGGGGDNFAVQITATLVVNTPGEYTFVVNCDDGARLRIDGQDVIVDDGTHAPGGNSGRITLTKPTAQLELIYYDATGGAEVELGWIRPNLTWQLLTTIAPNPPVVRGQVLISEFLADNGNGIRDEDDRTSDWIEIWNSTNATVSLGGYFLSDTPGVFNRWEFPSSWTLGPNQYLILFATGLDRKPTQAVPGQDNPGTAAIPHLHTNFHLSKTGGYLTLARDNGAGGYDVLSTFSPYPPQREDVSYGSSDSEGYIGYMETPTPGQPNGATVVDFVKGIQFSNARGRYSAPFTLTLSTATAGATIRYTTNGSTPTLNKGNIYSAPLSISRTTVVRAAAFKPGWKKTDVETQSYLFVDDIATQTTSTATGLGFPSGSVNGQVFRYGLNLTNVTSAGGNLQSLKNALAAAPTVCLTTDIGNLVDTVSGIYVNPGRHGLFWERPVSMEYINLAGTSEFQIDCGARVRGGFSRSATNPKHAFHMFFRKSLYDGDLNYRLFGAQGASQFSQIDLRCEQNYSWAFQSDAQNSLMREEWSRVSQGDMGQPYARTGYFHLYINGIYWGVYNFEERTEAAYGETYLGGTKENIDVVKSAGSPGYNTEMTDGNFAAWRNLFDQSVALRKDTTSETSRTARYQQMRGLNPDGTRNPNYPVLLDVDNLIDYLLVVFYDGSFDSPMSTFLNNASNNWFGVRDRLGTRGFTFYAHDHEHGMNSTGTNSYNRVGPWGDPNATSNNWGQSWTTSQYRSRETFTKSNPQYLHELLCFSAEYRQRVADRVQKHFFNGGALSNVNAVARVNALAAQVDPIIHAEAARWGSSSLNRNSWLNAKNTVLGFLNNGGFIPAGHPVLTPGNRASIVMQQLKGYTDSGAKPLFPNVNAPVFSGNFGGPVTQPYDFNITDPNASGGTIYYSVNGSDPRTIGGGIAPDALTGASPLPVTLTNTATVRARIFNSTTSTWSALTEAEYLVGAIASSTNLVISKIHYNPAGPADLEEFIEIMNIGSTAIDLTNCQFTLGIQFQFPDGYTLAPGARALIVRDQTAFLTTYGNGLAGMIAGVFANSTSLDNGGERLQFMDALNQPIKDFSYDDENGWPTAPDGEGPALVLKRPITNPEPSSPANWRASSGSSGSPGVDDALTYDAWAGANSVTDLTGTC